MARAICLLCGKLGEDGGRSEPWLKRTGVEIGGRARTEGVVTCQAG